MARTVALLAEGVDRNPLARLRHKAALVALLAEGVDRNVWYGIIILQGKAVALLAEGVDRNFCPSGSTSNSAKSPSSRRAWIEIPLTSKETRYGQVALLAEGVDRNIVSIYYHTYVWCRPPRGGRG